MEQTVIKRFRHYIEHGSWEDDLELGGDRLEWCCWIVIAFAAGYFGWIFFGMWRAS